MISLPLPMPVYIRIHGGSGGGEGEGRRSRIIGRRCASRCGFAESASESQPSRVSASPRDRAILGFPAFGIKRLAVPLFQDFSCATYYPTLRETISLSLSLVLSSFSPCLPLFPSATRVSFNSRPLSRELRRTHRKTAYRELQSLIRQKPLRAVNAANRAICILHGTRRGTSIRSRVDASPPAS